MLIEAHGTQRTDFRSVFILPSLSPYLNLSIDDVDDDDKTEAHHRLMKSIDRKSRLHNIQYVCK